MRYLFIVEGLDGCGKDLITTELLTTLKREFSDLKVTKLSFPNYIDDSSFFVRKMLSDELFDKPIDMIDPYLKSMIYTLDRRIYFENHQDLLEESDIVIMDRSYLSNLFYQFTDITQDISLSRRDRAIMLYKYFLYAKDFEFPAFGEFTENVRLLAHKDRYRHICIIKLTHETFNINLDLLTRENKEKDIYESNNSYLRRVNRHINELGYVLYKRISWGKDFKDILKSSPDDLNLFCNFFSWRSVQCSRFTFNSKSNDTNIRVTPDGSRYVLYSPHEIVYDILYNSNPKFRDISIINYIRRIRYS